MIEFDKDQVDYISVYWGNGWEYAFIGDMSKFTQFSKLPSIRAIKVAVKKDRENDK